MRNNGMKRCWVGITLLTVCLTGASVQGQLVLWRTFADPDSTSVCDVVNTDDAELVVLLNSDALTMVTGTDTLLANTEVDNSGDVFINGDPFGFIGFATDAEGFRTLWWMSFTGRVIHLDGVTLVPSESDVFPSDVANVPCDACPFWDDGAICTCIRDSECDDFDACTFDECDPLGGCAHSLIFCADGDSCTEDLCNPDEGCVFAEIVCDDENPCTDEACIGGDCIVVDLDDACDDGDECTVDDLCVDGGCVGIEVICADDDPCTEDSCDPRLGCIFAEIVCDDDNECTDEACVGGRCVFVENFDRCNDGDACTSDDRCDGGECFGTPISDCDNDGGSGGPIIVLCGSSMNMAFMLTFTGLLATGAARRRRST